MDDFRFVAFIYCVAVVPIAVFVGFMPITIGGMGTRDATFIYYSQNTQAILPA
jgi:uncharacterized membrane protein YbhN (UPF0104 family)